MRDTKVIEVTKASHRLFHFSCVNRGHHGSLLLPLATLAALATSLALLALVRKLLLELRQRTRLVGALLLVLHKYKEKEGGSEGSTPVPWTVQQSGR